MLMCDMLLLLAAAVLLQPVAAAETKRSVLMITVDDLRPQLGIYGMVVEVPAAPGPRTQALPAGQKDPRGLGKCRPVPSRLKSDDDRRGPGWAYRPSASKPPAVKCAAVPNNRRANCAYWGVGRAQCEARGCCFGQAGSFTPDPEKGTGSEPPPMFQHACFYPDAAVEITKVHVVQSNHFDAGCESVHSNDLNNNRPCASMTTVVLG